MALATRCPHCQTAFRVASDQLKLRSGLVRCGTCSQIFNGIENLVPADAELAPAAPAAPPSAPAAVQSEASRDLRPRSEKGDNTLFQELIAEVDHPETLDQPAAPLLKPLPEPQIAAIAPALSEPPAHAPARNPYAIDYAPIKLAALPRDTGTSTAAPGAWPVRAFLHTVVAPNAAPQDYGQDAPDDTGPEADSDPEAGAEGRREPVLFDFSEVPVAPTSLSATDAADADTSATLWAAAMAESAALDEAPALPFIGPPERVIDSDHQAAEAALAASDNATVDAMVDATTGAAAESVASDGNEDGDETDASERTAGVPGLIRAARIDRESDAALHRATPPASTPTVMLEEPAPEPPDFLSRDQQQQGLQRVLRPLSWIAAVVLALGLLAQVTYALRTTIAANFSPSRPMLETACRLIGCSVGLPMQIDAVSIESSDFQPIAGNPGHYLLNLLLRNRGTTVQTWPQVELTLNDASDKAVARRVIAPREYLPTGQNPARGIPAGSEQGFKLYFELSDLKASGYRVYLFYP